MNTLIQSGVQFDELTHSYLNSEDKFLIGVTSLMKKHGLSPDYSNISEEVLENAARRGTEAHELLEKYDNGEAVKDTPMLRSYKELNLNVLCSEYLVSDNEIVASKVDKVLSDYSLADVKMTSKIHYESLMWQLSIYAYLFEKQNPIIKVPALYVIHISKNGKVKIEKINRLPDSEIEDLFRAEREGKILSEIKAINENAVAPLSAIMTTPNLEELYNTEMMIKVLEENIAVLKEKKQSFHSAIYDYMEENGYKKMGNNLLEYTFVAPYSKNVLDTTALKADYPDIAEEYTKETLVKGSIRVKFNKKN